MQKLIQSASSFLLMPSDLIGNCRMPAILVDLSLASSSLHGIVY
ncbi:MAG: hypothetical protein ACTS73_07560 [Arsenophonus sp. NEOnobi-MAG3]